MNENNEGAVAEEMTPRHVAIIMDGNGRWARLRGKSRSAGHRAGGEVVKKVIEAAYQQRIPFLTLFAFSSENWQRPKKEVDLLMELFMRSLRREVKELHKNGVKVQFIGDRRKFADNLQQAMTDAEVLTKSNKQLVVNIAVGYGGRWDIIEASRSLAHDVESGHLKVCNITDQSFSERLSLLNKGIADPDLLIRTGGERRLSNFLLWQMAYTELYFCDTLWPDFNEQGFEEAVNWYTTRQRRFGKVFEESRETE